MFGGMLHVGVASFFLLTGSILTPQVCVPEVVGGEAGGQRCVPDAGA